MAATSIGTLETVVCILSASLGIIFLIWSIVRRCGEQREMNRKEVEVVMSRSWQSSNDIDSASPPRVLAVKPNLTKESAAYAMRRIVFVTSLMMILRSILLVSISDAARVVYDIAANFNTVAIALLVGVVTVKLLGALHHALAFTVPKWLDSTTYVCVLVLFAATTSTTILCAIFDRQVYQLIFNFGVIGVINWWLIVAWWSLNSLEKLLRVKAAHLLQRTRNYLVVTTVCVCIGTAVGMTASVQLLQERDETYYFHGRREGSVYSLCFVIFISVAMTIAMLFSAPRVRQHKVNRVIQELSMPVGMHVPRFYDEHVEISSSSQPPQPAATTINTITTASSTPYYDDDDDEQVKQTHI